MKCTAVGDMLLKESDFRSALQDLPGIISYQGLEWKADMDRTAMRELIRKIETEGSEAYSLPEEIYQAMIDSDVLFVHLCPVGKDVIRNASHLKYIFSARGGLENIAVKEAQAKGIHIIHCPMHNAHAVAEMTIGMMLCESRNLARADEALKNHIWREQYPNSGHITELRSMTIGIIGFGTIGRLVAELLQPFHTMIYANDPFVPADEIKKAGCVPVDRDTLLKQSDIITLHGRIGPNDPPLIGAEELKKMKPNAYLINTARAVLVDMDALADALKNHQIQGAALDVFPSEPPQFDHPIFKLDNVTLTNHRGGDTVDSYRRAPELLADMYREVMETGKTRTML